MKKILLLAVVCVFWFSLYLYVPFLTPYLISLGVTATLAGVIFAAHSFVQLVLRFPVGLKSDMLGRQKPFIVLGMVFSAIASILMYFFPSPAMLFAGNAISGVSSTMYVAFTVLYAKYYGDDSSNKAMGTIGAVVEVGIFAAFLAGGFLYQNAGIRILFLISALAAAAGAVLSLFVKEKPSAQVKIGRSDILAIAKNKELIVSSVLGVIIKAVVFATAFSFTPKIAQDIGATGAQTGAASALFIAASVLGSLFVTTRLGKRVGNAKTSVVGFFILAAYAAAVPFVHNVWLLMAVQFIGGLGYASLTAIFMANAIRRLKPDQKAAGMGLYQAIYSAGSALGPVLLGVFADSFSYTAGFIFIAALSVVGMAVSAAAGKRHLMD